MSNINIYPWHEPTLRHWSETIKLNRLTPVTMLRERVGFGDELLVRNMTQRLLCDFPLDGMPCQTCRHCSWIKEETHVNLSVSKLSDRPRSIKEIRQLEAQIWQTGAFNKPKIVNILNVDELSISAQSTLLKTLEEPPEETYFILSARNIGDVLPTVMSRARRLAHPKDDTGALWAGWVQMKTGLTELAIKSYFEQAKMSPLKLLEYVNEQDKLGALDQEKHQFKAFLTGKLSPNAYTAFLKEHDLVESLEHVVNMLDGLIKKLFLLAEKTIQTVWRTETSIKHLYLLRDIIDVLLSLSKTNCDLVLQTQSELTTWNYERRR